MSEVQVNNHKIAELFSTDKQARYKFKIPDYQRPYSWTINEVSSLLDDISGAFPYGGSTDHDADYFLGSVVLIKENGQPKSDIVDGQQRITTLTLIFSVICHLLPDKSRSNRIRSELIEKIDAYNDKIPALRLRDVDDDFFGKWIREGSKLEEMTKLDIFDKTDSQLSLIENVSYLLEQNLHKPDDVELSDWLIHLLTKITQNCYLVTISTEDFDSAYRIFSTINSRGLNLKPNDVLKSEIIGKIEPDLRSKYTQIWDIEESDLGRGDFERLFFTIRSFILNQNKYSELLKSYRKEILPQYQSAEFIDEVLKPSSDAFEHIRKGNFSCNNEEHQSKIRDLCLWLNEVDNNDWMPSAIYFMVKYPNDSELTLRFLTQLERLAAGLMIARIPRCKERENIFYDLINSIKEGTEQAITKAHDSITPTYRYRIVTALKGKIYEKRVKPFGTYVLLRLDSALADGGRSPSLNDKPTIEHILPQNPSKDSQWLRDWTDPNEIKQWVHHLGNLAFLSGKANARAKNYDFSEKKEKYFMSKSGAPVYPITTRVLNQNTWTPEIVKRFQEEYVAKLTNIWDLD
ncbi:MAG: DUF262 domain-containing protein [Thermosynechococcaceae cyanobacterium]